MIATRACLDADLPTPGDRRVPAFGLDDLDLVGDRAGGLADDGAEAADDGAGPGRGRGASAAGAPGIDEASLVRWLAQIAEHDERALSALYDATLSRVYGLVLRIVRNRAWAEEVVEDTYFQVWRQALRFDPGRGRAMGWLLGMARSRALDALRHESRFRHEALADDDSSGGPAEGREVADMIDCARGQVQLQQALLGLEAQPRQLLVLAFFRGLSHEQIAEQTALPLGTVKSQIRRAMITLRGLLQAAGLHALPG